MKTKEMKKIFRKKDTWFRHALKKRIIDYWDFNAFLYPQKNKIWFATTSTSFRFLSDIYGKRAKIIDCFDDLYLIEVQRK